MAAMTISADSGRIVEAQVQSQRQLFAMKMSKILSWGTAAVGAPMVAALWVLFFRPYVPVLAAAGGLMLLGVTAWFYPLFQRYDRATTGVVLLLGVILAATVFIALLMPALMPATLVGQVALILLAELLLGDRGGRWMIGACAVALAATYLLEIVWPAGWSVPVNEMAHRVIGVPTSVFALLVAAAVIRQSTRGQENSFRQVQHGKLEFEALAGTERKQRQRLQAAVERYVAYMAEVARGNLSARLSLDAQEMDDPLIVLGRNLNDTVASLQQMIAQIRAAATDLSSASAEILAATAQQAGATSEQSSSIAQASVTIQEVRSSAEQAAQVAQGVAELVQHTAQVAQAGQEAVAGTMAGMQEVKQRVDIIARNIPALSEQAQAIGQIIATVSEIAAQSNMLALNAAVEAARAGEAGQGFAVVAGEVRSLAEQSKAATVQVREILSEIQRGVNTVVMATEEGMRQVDAGTKVASDAGAAIEELSASVLESSRAAVQIAAAASQQLTGVTQISQAMQSIDQATAQNVAGARQVEHEAGNLNDLASGLRGLIERYGV